MANVIPLGLCQCGCGQRTTIPTKTYRLVGRISGVPMRFVQGHYANRKERTRRGPESATWKGGRAKTKAGYVLVKVGTDHPMADPYGRVYEHRLVMSEAIGRSLRRKEHVHHINEDKTDNRIENLMLFPDTGAHHRHHAEQRRLARLERV